MFPPCHSIGQQLCCCATTNVCIGLCILKSRPGGFPVPLQPAKTACSVSTKLLGILQTSPVVRSMSFIFTCRGLSKAQLQILKAGDCWFAQISCLSLELTGNNNETLGEKDLVVPGKLEQDLGASATTSTGRLEESTAQTWAKLESYVWSALEVANPDGDQCHINSHVTPLCDSCILL